MPRPRTRGRAIKGLLSVEFPRGTSVASCPVMRERLGDILVRYYGVAHDDVIAALGGSGFLGEELTRRGAVREGDLFRALAFQLGLPFANPVATAEIPFVVLDSIPPFIAAWEEVVPISRSIDAEGRVKIVVATAHPERHELRHEIEKITGATIEFAVALPSDLQAAVRRFYRSQCAPETDTLEITQPSLPYDINEGDPEPTRPSQSEPEEPTVETQRMNVIPSEPDYAQSTAV